MPDPRAREAFRTGATVVITAVVVLLLGGFAFALADSQARQRRDLERRFQDRARVTAALIESLLDMTTSSSAQDAAARLGDRRVDSADVPQLGEEGGQGEALVIAADGTVLAASPTARRLVGRNIADRAERIPAGLMPAGRGSFVRRALGGRELGSPVLRSPTLNDSVIELAVSFETPFGRRLLLTSVPVGLADLFLGSVMSRALDVGEGSAYLVDGRGRLIGGPGGGVPGRAPPSPTTC